jgi:hypothetical protein
MRLRTKKRAIATIPPRSGEGGAFGRPAVCEAVSDGDHKCVVSLRHRFERDRR